jgi:NifU-like protein involved in Fe-S cluster formation
MTLLQFSILLLLLLFFVGGWFILSYLLSPEMEDPDGYARVTGNCGDTMELGFKVEGGRIIETHHSTNGCSISGQCIESAARLLLDKTPKDVKSINMMHIMEEVGRLPDSHIHCAQLAETTIQKAFDDYVQKRKDG